MIKHIVMMKKMLLIIFLLFFYSYSVDRHFQKVLILNKDTSHSPVYLAGFDADGDTMKICIADSVSVGVADSTRAAWKSDTLIGLNDTLSQIRSEINDSVIQVISEIHDTAEVLRGEFAPAEHGVGIDTLPAAATATTWSNAPISRSGTDNVWFWSDSVFFGNIGNAAYQDSIDSNPVFPGWSFNRFYKNDNVVSAFAQNEGYLGAGLYFGLIDTIAGMSIKGWFLHESGPLRNNAFELRYEENSSNEFEVYNDDLKFRVDTTGEVDIFDTLNLDYTTASRVLVTNASKNVATSDFEIPSKGTFPCTLKTLSTEQYGTISYWLNYYQVTLQLPIITGTSNSVNFEIYGIPDLLEPDNDCFFPAPVGTTLDNGAGTTVPVSIEIYTQNNSLRFYYQGNPAGWTNSGAKGVSQLIFVIYTIS